MSGGESTGYRRFWTQLLDMARTHTNLRVHPKPGNDWYIGASRNGITYNYALRKDAAYVELWIDKGRGNDEANESIFQGLLAHKKEIEEAFGDRLVWHRADGRSRAVQYFASRYGFNDHNHWPEIQKALIDAMSRLEAACGPYLSGEPSRSLETEPTTANKAPDDHISQLTNTRVAPIEAERSIVTMANLEGGIAEFRRRWPGESDFHNRLYQELIVKREAGQLTWSRLVDELSAWGALRTSISGQNTSWYLERGEKPFRYMLVLVNQIQSAHAGHDPDITETHPEELLEMFEVAIGIKGTSRPMFASKLCHFLMPSAFPVADEKMLGISTIEGYWRYWQRCAEGWRASEKNEALKARLRHAMNTTPFERYPWAAKIGELCHSGMRQQHG